MYKNTRQFGSAILVMTILAICLSISFQETIADWVGPLANPGENNIAAPVNIGTTTQSKEGSLKINTIGNENGFIVYYGNVGVGSLVPYAKLDIAGGLKVGADPICNASKDGTIRYNFSNKKLEFCDSTSWKEFKIVCPTGFSDCNNDNTCECYAGTHHCSGTSCVVNIVPCTPNCTGKECGSDGCTGTCGSCGSHASCNGSGTCVCSSGYADCNNDNTCECATSNHHCSGASCICDPETCGSLGYTCGSHSDGCGGTLNCGTCSAASFCSAGTCHSWVSQACPGGSVTNVDLANSWGNTGNASHMVGCKTLAAYMPSPQSGQTFCNSIAGWHVCTEAEFKMYNNSCSGNAPYNFWLNDTVAVCSWTSCTCTSPPCAPCWMPNAVVSNGSSCGSDTSVCAATGATVVRRLVQPSGWPNVTPDGVTDVMGDMCCHN